MIIRSPLSCRIGNTHFDQPTKREYIITHRVPPSLYYKQEGLVSKNTWPKKWWVYWYYNIEEKPLEKKDS